MPEIDGQGITVAEMEAILCDRCHNAPLSYYCPACDYKVCSDCLPKSFRKLPAALQCKRCGHIDKSLETLIGQVSI